MEVYLQPFFTKGLIDNASARFSRLGSRLDVSEGIYFHVRYGMIACVGIAQSVAYLAAWIFSSLTTMLTLGMIGPLDRFSDRAGSLALGSFLGAMIAACGVFCIEAPRRLAAQLTDRVERCFKEQLTLFDQDLLQRAAMLRKQRTLRGSLRENGPHPEAYFDPAVKEMIRQRKKLICKLRAAYPKEENAKYANWLSMKKQIRQMAESQLQRLSDLPITRREIDAYLMRQSAIDAEEAIEGLNQHCLKERALRIRRWGHKFDRESFSRHCLKLLKKKKPTKFVRRLVQDVKDAEKKGKAFKEFERELKSFIHGIKSRVSALDRPWPWVRMWRCAYPWICSWKLAQAADQLFDPDMKR